MRATTLEKAVAVRLATAMGHFKTKQNKTCKWRALQMRVYLRRRG